MEMRGGGEEEAKFNPLAMISSFNGSPQWAKKEFSHLRDVNDCL